MYIKVSRVTIKIYGSGDGEMGEVIACKHEVMRLGLSNPCEPHMIVHTSITPVLLQRWIESGDGRVPSSSSYPGEVANNGDPVSNEVKGGAPTSEVVLRPPHVACRSTCSSTYLSPDRLKKYDSTSPFTCPPCAEMLTISYLVSPLSLYGTSQHLHRAEKALCHLLIESHLILMDDIL